MNGDGAAWIEECTSYFQHCVFTLDRFHVALELKQYVGHLSKTWEKVRKTFASFDQDTLLETLVSVPETNIAKEWRGDWRK